MKTKGIAARRPRVRQPRYVIHVFVAGQDRKSRQAIENLKQLCDTGLPGDYRIEIVDLCKNPGAAQKHDLVALPAIVRTLPTPIRKFVGTFTDKKWVVGTRRFDRENVTGGPDRFGHSRSRCKIQSADNASRSISSWLIKMR